VRDVQQPPYFRAPNDVVRYTTEELLDIAAQYAANEEVAGTPPIPGGRKPIHDSRRAAPSNIVIQGAKKDAKGSKKRQKRCPQWIAVTAGYGDDDGKKEDSSDKEYITAARHQVKCQARSPTDNFERRLEEACLNHAYHIKHKLKDCAMMKNFLTSECFTQEKEPEEDLGGRVATPFPEEDVVLMVYDGHPHPRKRHMSNLSPGTPTHCG
jgi:hypothetical protein